MDNNIWIRLTFYHDNQLKCKEELVTELRQVCTVQVNTEWCAAASSGTELVAEILANVSLSDWFENALIFGLAWDAFKHSVSNIWNAIIGFSKKNEEVDLHKLIIKCNDINIVLNGVMGDQLAFAHDMYDCIRSHWPTLHKEDIKDIIRIELPLRPNDSNSDVMQYIDFDVDETPDNCAWKITYNLGLDVCYYVPSLKRVIAC